MTAETSLLPRPIDPTVSAVSFAATGTYRDHKEEKATKKARDYAFGMYVGLVVGAIGVSAAAFCSYKLATRPTDTRIWVADKSTGTMVLMPSYEQAVAQEPIIMHVWFAERYVTARESWISEIAPFNERTVDWASGDKVRAEFDKSIEKHNPDAPRNKYGSSIDVLVDPYGYDGGCPSDHHCDLKIYYRRWTHQRGDVSKPAVEHWTATLGFEIQPRLIPEDGRGDNPDGMITTYYHAQRNDVQR